MQFKNMILAVTAIACCGFFSSCSRDTSASDRRDQTGTTGTIPGGTPGTTGNTANTRLNEGWRTLRTESASVLDTTEREIEALKTNASEAARNAHESLSQRLNAARTRAEELGRQTGATADQAWQDLQKEIDDLRAEVRRVNTR